MNVLEQAQELLRNNLVVDSLAGGPGVVTDDMLEQIDSEASTFQVPDLFREIERIQTYAFISGQFDAYWSAIDRAGVDVLSISIGAWGDAPFSFRGAVYDFGEWHRRLRAAPRLHLITDPADLPKTKHSKRTGLLLGFQACDQLEGDLRNLETFQGLGLRMIQLTYNGAGPAGYGCTAAQDFGLTRFGRELIRAANALGIILDTSHCGPLTTLETIKYSKAPVAVSHAACAAVHNHARNKSDDILKALADTGGYLGICAVPAFLAPLSARPSLSHMVDHVRHALDVCGPETVGIGTDWGVEHSPVVVRRALQEESRRRGFRPTDDFDFADRTEGFETWSRGWPSLTAELIRSGVPLPVLTGILGRNFAAFYHRVADSAA